MPIHKASLYIHCGYKEQKLLFLFNGVETVSHEIIVQVFKESLVIWEAGLDVGHECLYEEAKQCLETDPYIVD